jgi:hypothetical protein
VQKVTRPSTGNADRGGHAEPDPRRLSPPAGTATSHRSDQPGRQRRPSGLPSGRAPLRVPRYPGRTSATCRPRPRPRRRSTTA